MTIDHGLKERFEEFYKLHYVASRNGYDGGQRAARFLLSELERIRTEAAEVMKKRDGDWMEWGRGAQHIIEQTRDTLQSFIALAEERQK